MAKLDAAERDELPDSDFALSGRRYPINDREHADKALQLGAREVKAGKLSAAEYRRVKAAVHMRYPEVGEGNGGSGKADEK